MLRKLGERQPPGNGSYVDRERLVAVAAIRRYPHEAFKK